MAIPSQRITDKNLITRWLTESKNKDLQIRRNAMFSLRHSSKEAQNFNAVLNAFGKALGDKDEKIVSDACGFFWDLRDTNFGKYVPKIAKLLSTRNVNISWSAAMALARAADNEKPKSKVVKILIKKLSGPEPGLQIAVMESLREMAGSYGINISAALPKLEKLLESKNVRVRESAQSTIEKFKWQQKYFSKKK